MTSRPTAEVAPARARSTAQLVGSKATQSADGYVVGKKCRREYIKMAGPGAIRLRSSLKSPASRLRRIWRAERIAADRGTQF